MNRVIIKPNYVTGILVTLVSMFFCAVAAQNTFANSWISLSIWPICDSDGCSDCCGCHPSDQHQRFGVSYDWNSKCKGSGHYQSCNMIWYDSVGYCHNPGKPCPSSSNVRMDLDCSNRAIGKGEAIRTVCSYTGWIAGGGSSYQNVYMDGKFDRYPKIYTLYMYSLESGTGSSLNGVTGLQDRSESIYYGDKTWLTRGYTNTGYIFDGIYGVAGDTVAWYLTGDAAVYAYYHGDSGTSSTGITVKNNSIGKYSTPTSTVYAKPGTIRNGASVSGDLLTYDAWYSPGAQSATKYYPQNVEINGGSACGYNNVSYTTNQLFYYCKGGLNSWSNAYSVVKDNFTTDKDTLNFSYNAGDTNRKSSSNNHTVHPQEAGMNLVEHSKTNHSWATQTTPKSYRIGLASNGGSSAKIDTTTLDATAKAIVPYNFENKTHKPSKSGEKNVNDDDDYYKSDDELIADNKIVYAGEEDYFNYIMDVNPKQNNVTEGYYATLVRNAKWRLELCYDTDCAKGIYSPSEERTDTLNKSGNIFGQQNIESNAHRISIPDRYAGSRVCIRSAIYPATSGSDTNTNVNGNGQWAPSNRSCYIIAKRPSTQVWGGNIYSRSKIDTQPSVKNNLYGYSEYAYDANANNRKRLFIFGSWGELGVIGNDTISGFGSGASMGYAKNEGSEADGRVKTWPAYHPADGAGNNAFIVNKDATPPGGSAVSAFCGRVPLTIPNSPCGTSVGSLSSTVSITKAASEKTAIIDLLVSGQGTAGHIHNPSGGVNMGLIGGKIEGNTTKVVSSDNDLVVNGDLIYLDGVYINYEQMPKLVIYSKKNIYIDCAVSRIDALLIAEDTVVTCNNFEGSLTDANVTKHINDPANSNQLYINGTIIASRLVANRTYGAATGANSIVSAEVINFDPTLYQFGGSAEADDDTTGRLDTTYMHELPPRL